MPRLTNLDRGRILGLLDGRANVTDIAERFGVNRRTIQRLQHRFTETGSIDDRPRSGRPSVTSQRQDRYIVASHARNRFLAAARSARQLSALWNIPVSRQTVVRRLQTSGFRCRRPYQGCILSHIHRQRRLLWTTTHQRWTRHDWSRVLFTDESRFCLRSADGRQRVYRRSGERYADNCVQE